MVVWTTIMTTKINVLELNCDCQFSVHVFKGDNYVFRKRYYDANVDRIRISAAENEESTLPLSEMAGKSDCLKWQ